VINGGTLTMGTYFDIGNSSSFSDTGPAGTLTVQGFGSRYVQTGGGFSLWGSNPADTASITFASGGAGTLSNGVKIGPTEARPPFRCSAALRCT